MMMMIMMMMMMIIIIIIIIIIMTFLSPQYKYEQKETMDIFSSNKL